jgi:hypothetical protein
MKMNQKLWIVFVAFNLYGIHLFAQSDSTAAIRLLNGSKIQKAGGDLPAYRNHLVALQAGIEQLREGKFTLLLNAMSNGQYEIQVYRMVPVGKKRIVSTFYSVFRASVEYSYEYDAKNGSIKQHHYICPPDSLTCWANPGDYANMNQFSWKESFPASNCAQPVFTSEEYGREYLQASCFSTRDAALTFAQKFIQYITGPRGM